MLAFNYYLQMEFNSRSTQLKKKKKKKEAVCSQSTETKLVKPESLMWESCIVQDHTNSSGALRCMPERRSQGSVWNGESQE